MTHDVRLHIPMTHRNDRYVAESKGGRAQHKMGHLACFMGGLYGLASKDAGPNEAEYMELGEAVTNTCHEGYRRSASGIGPESMEFNSKVEATAARAGERYYILRPETVEAYVGWTRREIFILAFSYTRTPSPSLPPSLSNLFSRATSFFFFSPLSSVFCFLFPVFNECKLLFSASSSDPFSSFPF